MAKRHAMNRKTASGNGDPRVLMNDWHKSRKEAILYDSCHPYVKNSVARDVYSAGNAA